MSVWFATFIAECILLDFQPVRIGGIDVSNDTSRGSGLPLILLFVWWGSNAVFRYWSQPLSTDISYKYGETNQGIQFPLITLCNLDRFDNKILRECNDGSWNFISILVSCMKINKTLKVADHMHPELKNRVETVQLWTGTEYINLQHFYGTVWAKVFHEKGPCYMFDLSKVEKFKYVSLEAAGGTPGIEFAMAENNLWQKVVLMLHTRFDLPEAYKLNGKSKTPIQFVAGLGRGS